MFNKLLINDGEFLIFNGLYVEFYVPKSYEEDKLAESVGDSYRLFGICNLRVFDVNNKPGKLEILNLPSYINVFPSEVDEANLSLVDGQEEEKYKILKFYKGDKIMRNVTQMDSTNLEMFTKLMTSGKIPKTVEYKNVIHLWLKNMEINGKHLGVTSTVLEVIIAEIYRDGSKPEFQYAKTVGKDPNKPQYGYRTANIREICSRNSAFAALTFEDMDSMITSSLNINKYNKSETLSPIEKIIKM